MHIRYEAADRLPSEIASGGEGQFLQGSSLTARKKLPLTPQTPLLTVSRSRHSKMQK